MDIIANITVEYKSKYNTWEVQSITCKLQAVNGLSFWERDFKWEHEHAQYMFRVNRNRLHIEIDTPWLPKEITIPFQEDDISIENLIEVIGWKL